MIKGGVWRNTEVSTIVTVVCKQSRKTSVINVVKHSTQQCYRPVAQLTNSD